MLLLTLFSIFLYLKGLVERWFLGHEPKNPFVRDWPTDVLSYNLCKREKPSRWFFPSFKKPKTTFFALNVFPGLFYSSTEILSQAQKSMMRKMAGHLSLTPGTRILDIGCSSPALISHLAQTYDVYIDGITSSPSRYEMCCSLNLGNCNFYLVDFVEFSSPLPYHRIYSSTPFIYQDDTFLQKIRSHLLDDGYFFCFLLQGESLHSWLNMELGLMDRKVTLEDKGGLVLSLLEDLTLHYDKTLLLKSFLCENKLGNYTLGVLSGCLRARKMRLYQCLFKREQV